MKVYGNVTLSEGSDFKNLTVDHGDTYPANPNIGELFYHNTSGLACYNGTSWISVSNNGIFEIADGSITDAKLSLSGVTAGTFAQVTVNDKGRVTAGSATLPWSQVSGVPAILPNLSQTVAVAGISGTSLIPFDNTTPLITEGTQLASVSCTPSDAASKLAMQGALVIDCGSSNRNFTLAMFRGNTCVCASSINFVSAGRPQIFPFFMVDDQAGPLLFGGSGVYSLRIGINSSATWYVNRTATAVLNGMMANNDIMIWEYI